MESPLRDTLNHALAEHFGTSLSIAREASLGGGCINRACRLELTDGRQVLLKSNSRCPPDMFPAEHAGLQALHQAGSIRVAQPLLAGHCPRSGVYFLIIEYIQTGRRPPDFSARFGRQLAALHQDARHDRFGFDGDNYLGSTPQPNTWHDDWVEFWRERRLGFQLDLARRDGRANEELNRLGDRLVDRLDEWIAEPAESPALLHGDLWGGNYLIAPNGDPVLIDPAVYYGRREAELAMTRLFGGFDREFAAAYHEAWPLADGSAERIEIYQLYHLLNHLNLFGHSYMGACLEILRKYG